MTAPFRRLGTVRHLYTVLINALVPRAFSLAVARRRVGAAADRLDVASLPDVGGDIRRSSFRARSWSEAAMTTSSFAAALVLVADAAGQAQALLRLLPKVSRKLRLNGCRNRLHAPSHYRRQRANSASVPPASTR